MFVRGSLVTLRPILPTDAAQLLVWCAAPGHHPLRPLGEPGRSVTEEELYLFLGRRGVNLLIVQQETESVGYVCMTNGDPWNGYAEVSLFRAPGRRLPPVVEQEAWMLFLDLLKRWFPLAQIGTSIVESDDVMLDRVRALGFTDTGHAPWLVWDGTQQSPLVLLRLDQERWEDARRRISQTVAIQRDVFQLAASPESSASNGGLAATAFAPLAVRPLTAGDLEAAFTWHADPSIPHAWNQARRWLPYVAFVGRLDELKRQAHVEILAAASGEPVGYLQLAGQRRTDGTAYLDTYLAPPFRAVEHWREAFQTAVQRLESNRELRKIYTEVLGYDPERILGAQEAGFVAEGETPGYFWFNGHYQTRYRLAYYFESPNRISVGGKPQERRSS